MKINTDTQFRQTGTMQPTQRARMSVDQNNIQHIMSVLTDLYSDPMMAVIREYSTNAHDSHIAAGVEEPIRVFLPGPFDRSFRVEDNGLGLSVDDLINVCSKYGYSTKRDNDNESGMLGLGFKAGLTYTDQFSVTAIKDGVKTAAIVARDEDGAGVIDIVDTVTTDEKNGVTIRVAVKDSGFFNMRAKEFFRFWTPGTVLVDGEEPSPIEGLRITDDITVVPDHGLAYDYVVMGNIGYRVDGSLSRDIPYGYSVVANVKMGEVNFTPNREALHYTPRTEAALDRIRLAVKTGVQRSAQEEIDKAATHREAFEAAQHWVRLVRGQNFTYRGEAIPWMFNGKGWTYDTRAHRYATSSFGQVDYRTMTNAIQVTGYENENVSTTVRRKARVYMEENDIDKRTVIFTDNRIGGKWTEGMPEVDYSVIKAIKLNSGSRATGPGAGAPISYYQGGQGGRAPVDQIPGNKKVVYSPATEDISWQGLSNIFPDVTFVELARNRWEKFMRENKGSDIVDNYLSEALEKIVDEMALSERLNISGAEYQLGTLKGVDSNKIDDPELAELVRGYNTPIDDELVRKYRQVRSLFRHLDVEAPSIKTSWKEILDKYPLLGYNERVDPDHIYEYVNHFYKESK